MRDISPLHCSSEHLIRLRSCSEVQLKALASNIPTVEAEGLGNGSFILFARHLKWSSAFLIKHLLVSRDGDRFFYTAIDWGQDILGRYPYLQRILNNDIRLADIIVQNTRITYEELGGPFRKTVFVTSEF